MNGPGALIVFAREPTPGLVKTRLIPVIGADGAARVYARLLSRAIECAQGARVDSRYLFAAEPGQLDYFAARPQLSQWRLAVQTAGDLGQRMAAAFAQVLASHPFAVLIGTDICDGTVADLDAAHEALASGNDAVVGPCADGGYWLLGLREATPGLFANMPWGTHEVFAQTRDVLEAKRCKWSVLPLRHDIDRAEDLALLPGDLYVD